MDDFKDCSTIFSNGTEFELFYAKCEKCSRYRNEKCRVLQACFRAMFDKDEFPYADLQDHVKYGGKRCKHFTEEPLPRRKRTAKQITGQLELKL